MLVYQENTIGVAVEGKAEVGPVLGDGSLEVDLILGLDRVCRTVSCAPDNRRRVRLLLSYINPGGTAHRSVAVERAGR